MKSWGYHDVDNFVRDDENEIKPTMLKWIEKMKKLRVYVIAAKKDSNLNYFQSGNYNQVLVRAGDVIEVMFSEDSDGMDFVYYRKINE